MNNLTIRLEPGTSKSMYEQLYEYVRNEIIDGKISQGEKLPSTRFLSTNLGVSRNTVERAYEQLQAEGYIEAKACSGYVVCDTTGFYSMKKDEVSYRHAVQDKEDERETLEENIIDFSKSGVDLEVFPLATWRKISRGVLQEDVSLLEACNPVGELELRTEISKYLYRARGVRCTEEQIIIGAGNDYLLMLLTRILNRHNIVAMEKPSYGQAYHALQQANCNIVEIEMDDSGLKVEQLRKTDANMVYVMPSHQYPLGVVMPITRRLELLKWAAEGNRYIIEDDYDSEFRYKGKPIPALQGYDKDEKVIYIGTFSKSIAPAIRVSYMVLPKHLINIYKEECGVFSATVSKIQQETIRVFMKEGYFERHLNKMRNRYKEKRDCLVAALGEIPEGYLICGEDAGMHFLLEYPLEYDKELDKQLKEAGIIVNSVETKKGYCALILNYGHLSMEQLIEGGNRLKDILIEKV